MLGEFYSLSREEAETGVLGRQAVDFLFDNVPKHVRRIAVRYRPLHVRRQSRHTRSRGDGLPLEVTPVVTQAQVTREGRIIPTHSVIGRDILDPLARGAFSVGSVADLDSFLTAKPFPPKEEDPDLWQKYQDHWRQIMAEVSGNWPASDPEYQIVGYGLIRPATEAAATVKHILDLADTLIHDAPESPLLANFAQDCLRRRIRAPAPFPLAKRLGQPAHIRRDALEASILKGLRKHLMDPALFREFCDEFTNEVNRLRIERGADLEGWKRELERTGPRTRQGHRCNPARRPTAEAEGENREAGGP